MSNDLVQFKSNLRSLSERGELALPSNVSPEAFQNAAIVAVQDNAHILKCDQGSIFRSIRKIAGMGLVPDGREAAMVPFKGQCVPMPMVFGLIKMARNSGEVASLWAEVIYEGEVLNVSVVEGERAWDHVMEDGSAIDFMDRGGKIRGAYAVVKFKDGTVDMEPMSRAEIEKRRIASANQKDAKNPTGIWQQWYEEMAKKTVIRGLCKRLPMSGERLQQIMESDGPMEAIQDITPGMTPGQARAHELLGKKPPQDDPPADDGDVVDAEVVEPKIDPESEFFKEGVKSYGDFGPGANCPESYAEGSVEHLNWKAGFDQEFEKEQSE